MLVRHSMAEKGEKGKLIMFDNLEFRRCSICEIYSHSLVPTKEQGIYKCRICRAISYCPDCDPLTIPVGALRLRCEQHKKVQ